MLETSPVVSSRLSGIEDELQDLRRRVAALESKVGMAPESKPEPLILTPAHTVPEIPTTGLITVLGRAMLGIAGAYLLRAVFESGAIPAGAGAAATILYAMWWLRTARDVAARDTVAVNVYAATAGAIVYPMLWEVTVRFQAASPPITAAVLVLFAVLGFAAAWKANLTGVVWITVLGSIGTALGLLLATRDMVAFTAALLAVAAVVEAGACRDHWIQLRGIASFSAGLAVLLAIYLIASPRGLPEGYVPFTANHAIVLALALLLITLTGTIVRTLVRGLDITKLEVVQLSAAMALAIAGSLRIAGPTGALWTGAAVTMGAAACYVVSFLYLDRAAGKNRNFYIYSTLALVLATAGTLILLRGTSLTILWSTAAAAATGIGIRAERTSVRFHGVLYLLFAGAASGAFAASLQRILAAGAAWSTTYSIPLAAAACCYVISLRRREEASRDTYSTFTISAILLLLLAGLLAGAVSHTPAGLPARTAMLTAAAVLLAFAGRRWSRPELTWLVYPSMALAAYRLVTQDFPQAKPAGLAVSLLFFGGAMILLPRVFRSGRA